MAVTPETLRLSEDARKALANVLGAQVNALTKAWIEAWGYLLPEFEASLADLMLSAKDGRPTRRQIEEHARLGKTLVLAQERLQELSDGIEPLVADDLGAALREGYKAHASAIASQLPANQPGIVIA